jgi:molybdopterin-guanine dinucleotide biosynthesis protein A
MDALILAGGENKRFLSHKGLAEINGKRIIDTISELLVKHFNNIFVSTNNPEKFYYLGFTMIGDILKYRGAMTGIFSTLVCTGTSEVFVTACDMPFINPGLVSTIIEKYNGQDALIPVFKCRPQPLLGIYAGRIAGMMEERIIFKKRGMLDLLKEINVSYIDEDRISMVDPEGKSFVNINTVADLNKISGGPGC